MSDTTKRARVMARSQKLGHCICDPRKPCPCDVLLEKDVCLCAGERLEASSSTKESIALTKLVKNAGCASKIPPAELAAILTRLPQVSDPRLLVGAATADDAGIFQVSDDLCLVQTVDVFTPSVDDPYTFGKIAACNSLSDVYAMGGTPLTALSIIGYPIHTLDSEWMYQILKGGMDALAEAGVVLAGGHSINDEEIKFGFAVTGRIDPRAMVTNAGAKPGDVLILTRPVGTGIIAFASQIGRASEHARQTAATCMSTSNKAAANVMVEMGAHACTDITGFGLLGHLFHIVRESRVTAEIYPSTVPLLPEVSEYAAQGIVSGGMERNREYAGQVVTITPGISEAIVDILYDPQTSGGLLFTVSADKADETIRKLHAAGCSTACMVGRITDNSQGRIIVTEDASQCCCRSAVSTTPADEPCCSSHGTASTDSEAGCCSENQSQQVTGAPDIQRAFQQFMTAAFAPGALDVIQKEIITIALAVATGCEPCLQTHLAKAKSMGISNDEIQEAAWLGVAFGGAKAMMFWTEQAKKL